MILNKIIDYKKKELKKSKKRFPLESFKNSLKKSNRDFKKAVKAGLIAEIKLRSPSEGVVRHDFNIFNIVKVYNSTKEIRAISVLTDTNFFGGGKTSLSIVRALTKKPLLRKDFIIDPYQIYESRYYGADAVLLIARILSKDKIKKFIRIAKKYDMDCLVEVHSEGELNKLPSNVEIVGINNRDLDTLEVDLNTTLRLSKKIKGKIIVTESGYKTKKQIDEVKGKVNAFLIGTALLKSKNIKKKVKELFKGQ